MKYKRWVSKLTIKERASMLTGKDFWNLNSVDKLGIPSIMMTDGPHGLRKQNKTNMFGESIKTVCFPTSSTLACSWDKNLLHEIGKALGDECRQEKVSILLGPGINIKRSPLCGRNFEYFSEDPILTGELATEYINGVQSRGVGVSLKHFAVNSQEASRMVSDSLVDERALREIYLLGFEIAVKRANPWTIMSAYNMLNGTYCTENSYLLKDILRDEWGFEGVTISDWMAVNDRVKALNAGLDIEMPSSGRANIPKIAEAYRENEVTAETLNESVDRVMDLIHHSELNLTKSYTYDVQAHKQLAQKAAEQSIVLLKNESKILPLKQGSKVAVIGAMAKDPVIQGFGSSRVNATDIDNAFDELIKENLQVTYARGYRKINDAPDSLLISQACQTAKNAEIAVIFVGLTDKYLSEGFDRDDMRLPECQNILIEAVSQANPNTVVVVSGGSAVEMPWHMKAKAILFTYLPGQEGGKAVSNILTGRICPSGKLPETFPITLKDTPCRNYYPGKNNLAIYKESIFVGYRYYEKAKVPVLFPFGHGLSYSDFEYMGMEISSNEIGDDDDELTVTVHVKNTGRYNAAEVVQLYVSGQDSKVFRPVKELKGFEKVFLKPGEMKKVEFKLGRRSFSYYSSKLNKWCVERGAYKILVGSSSFDIRLKAEVYYNSSNSLMKERDYRNLTPSYFTGNVKSVDDEEFQNLFNYYIEDFIINNQGVITGDNTLIDAVDTELGGKINEFIKALIERIFAGDEIMGRIGYESVMYNIPIKRFVAVSKGLFTDKMLEGLLNLLNGKNLFEGRKQLKPVIKSLNDTIKTILQGIKNNNLT